MADKKAQLSVDGKTIELPVYSGTLGPDVIDVRSLVQEGLFTYDPGFMSTAACESQITYIVGANGVLLPWVSFTCILATIWILQIISCIGCSAPLAGITSRAR